MVRVQSRSAGDLDRDLNAGDLDRDLKRDDIMYSQVEGGDDS